MRLPTLRPSKTAANPADLPCKKCCNVVESVSHRRRCVGRLILSLVTASFVAFVLATGAGAATVVNGDFETGDFTGWTTWNAGGFGEWFVYTGTVSPISNNQIAAPPEGTYAATTD